MDVSRRRRSLDWRSVGREDGSRRWYRIFRQDDWTQILAHLNNNLVCWILYAQEILGILLVQPNSAQVRQHFPCVQCGCSPLRCAKFAPKLLSIVGCRMHCSVEQAEYDARFLEDDAPFHCPDWSTQQGRRHEMTVNKQNSDRRRYYTIWPAAEWRNAHPPRARSARGGERRIQEQTTEYRVPNRGNMAHLQHCSVVCSQRIEDARIRQMSATSDGSVMIFFFKYLVDLCWSTPWSFDTNTNSRTVVPVSMPCLVKSKSGVRCRAISCSAPPSPALWLIRCASA